MCSSSITVATVAACDFASFGCVPIPILSRKLLNWCSECMGCCEMDDSGPDFEEPCKKKKKSTVTAFQNSLSTTRFASPVSPGKMSEMCNGYVPPTTVRATNWAVRVLDEWWEERNKRCSERCPSDLLERPAAESVACSFCRGS